MQTMFLNQAQREVLNVMSCLGKDDEKYVTVMQKIIDLLPSWRKEHYYSEIGKIVLGRK